MTITTPERKSTFPQIVIKIVLSFFLFMLLPSLADGQTNTNLKSLTEDEKLKLFTELNDKRTSEPKCETIVNIGYFDDYFWVVRCKDFTSYIVHVQKDGNIYSGIECIFVKTYYNYDCQNPTWTISNADPSLMGTPPWKREDTDLTKAVNKGDLNQVSSLLESGVDVNEFGKRRTPLGEASARGYMDIVKLLVEAGADLELRNPESKYSRDETALNEAAMFGFTEIVEYLLSKGAKVNTTIRYDKGSVLHLMARRQSHTYTPEGIEIAKILLKSGENVNTLNKDGRTALHYATLKPATEFATLLLENGADPNITDKYGATPLDYAKWWDEKPELQKILSNSGGRPGNLTLTERADCFPEDWGPIWDGMPRNIFYENTGMNYTVVLKSGFLSPEYQQKKLNGEAFTVVLDKKLRTEINEDGYIAKTYCLDSKSKKKKGTRIVKIKTKDWKNK